MRKNVWIWNHYATNMFFDKSGRHYCFAEILLEAGYKPNIFCASTNHFSCNHYDTHGKNYSVDYANSIPFVFVNTTKYNGNGLQRVINILKFYKRIFKVANEYAKVNGKPDIIIASSVHPLTLVAGIKVAKKYDVPCICEVRDLWPESLVAYGKLKKDSLVAKLLYIGEKWIYKKATSIIMTWEGGSQYIIDKGWGNQIDINKVVHISNGVRIKSFDKNAIDNKISDPDLNDINFKNVVYAGSIRKVNNIGLLIKAAQIVQMKNDKIRFLIYGAGDEKKMLELKCKDESIHNVIFKGQVEKKVIPSILKSAYVNILHNSSTVLDKYGQSQNKFFEYLASGKCVIQTYSTSYSIIDKYNCGISAKNQSPEEIADIILKICSNEALAHKMGVNARNAAYNYDFENLSKKLIDIIEM